MLGVLALAPPAHAQSPQDPAEALPGDLTETVPSSTDDQSASAPSSQPPAQQPEAAPVHGRSVLSVEGIGAGAGEGLGRRVLAVGRLAQVGDVDRCGLHV